MWQAIDSAVMRKRFTLGGLTGSRHPVPSNDIFLGDGYTAVPDNAVLNPAIKRCRWATGLCSFLPFWSLSISAGCRTQDVIFGVSPARGLLSAEMKCKCKQDPREPEGWEPSSRLSKSLGFTLQCFFFFFLIWCIDQSDKGRTYFCATQRLKQMVEGMIFCLCGSFKIVCVDIKRMEAYFGGNMNGVWQPSALAFVSVFDSERLGNLLTTPKTFFFFFPSTFRPLETSQGERERRKYILLTSGSHIINYLASHIR